MSDSVFELVIPYVRESRDRAAVSLVCRRAYELDSLTRKQVKISLCYTTTPERLRRRFPNLESLKLKGKPRPAYMFSQIPSDWGGYVTPWVEEISWSFPRLTSLHFRRMIVRDTDLDLIARTCGHVLQELKLDRCSGFSTDGLFHICRSCRKLKTLFLEESKVDEKDGKWLHELALNNKVLETLNFYLTELDKFNFSDFEVIAKSCPLVSVKISTCDLLDLVGFFRAAATLEEFCGGTINQNWDEYTSVRFPPNLQSLGLSHLRKQAMPIVFPFCHLLKKLDLLYLHLDPEDHCVLLQRCSNLENLETKIAIGDRGVAVLGRYCKKMKRLKIEGSDDEDEFVNEGGVVSHRGLIALSEGCLDLEYIDVYVSDINNAALESMGTHLKNLNDFRLVLLNREDHITELPLDNGVRALLIGCPNLRRFALDLRIGGLSDVGLGYVGQYSQNVRWMFLGCVGESDAGLLEFSRGCPSLQKLEMRGCRFSNNALVTAVLQLVSLRHLWVQAIGIDWLFDFNDSYTNPRGSILQMARPFWNMEMTQVRIRDEVGFQVDWPQLLAYYSLADHRTDFPEGVIPIRVYEYDARLHAPEIAHW